MLVLSHRACGRGRASRLSSTYTPHHLQAPAGPRDQSGPLSFRVPSLARSPWPPDALDAAPGLGSSRPPGAHTRQERAPYEVAFSAAAPATPMATATVPLPLRRGLHAAGVADLEDLGADELPTEKTI